MRAFSRWPVAMVGCVTLLVVAACATPVSPGSPGGGGEGWPADRTFIASSVIENGSPKELVEGTRILVSFGADGQVSANAGCNHMGGGGRLESGRLIIDGLGMTEMGCPGARVEQDAWVAEFLTSRPTLDLDGDTLTLTGEAITMSLLDREVADPDRPLTGTAWTVHTIFEGDSASSTAHPVPAVLTIDASTSTFEATTGCVGGLLQGSAAVAGGQVTFVVTAEQACVGGSNPVDEAVRATLAGPVTYEIEADQLRLLRPDGNGIGLGAQDGAPPIDCGVTTLGQGEQPSASMLTCFLDAVAAGRPVHLTIVRPTVEGDPIATTYRADGGATIEVTVDARQDRFGSGAVEYQICEEPSVAEDGFLGFARCN